MGERMINEHKNDVRKDKQYTKKGYDLGLAINKKRYRRKEEQQNGEGREKIWVIHRRRMKENIINKH